MWIKDGAALPTHDEEGHPFVECEECGKPTLDDNTDECHNPDCPTNERIRERLQQMKDAGSPFFNGEG